MLTSQEKLNALIDHYSNGNKAQFAKLLGVKPQTINSWLLRGTFDEKLIYSKCEYISSSWLLTGEGDMLISEDKPVKSYTEGRPYYDVDFIGGFDLVMNEQTATPSYLINFPPYNKDGVIWCNITGHSMEPKISHGDVIAIKEVVDWQSYMSYGEVYAIVTKNDMRTVKIVRKGSDDEHLRLVPINAKDYDEQEIERGMIERVFSVLACMKKV